MVGAFQSPIFLRTELMQRDAVISFGAVLVIFQPRFLFGPFNPLPSPDAEPLLQPSDGTMVGTIDTEYQANSQRLLGFPLMWTCTASNALDCMSIP